MRQIAIGDVHGCLATLEALLDKLNFSKNDELILLGDLVDRGPNSKGVVDLIMRLNTEGYAVSSLLGNHDFHVMNCFEDKTLSELDDMTFESFGGKTLIDTTNYIRFFRKMPIFLEKNGFLLVHAGFNFTQPDFLADKDAMIWERRWYDKIDYAQLGNRIILHGHTPTPVETVKEQVENIDKNQYLNLDTGACYTKKYKDGFGSLSAFDMTNRVFYTQKNVDVGNVY